MTQLSKPAQSKSRRFSLNSTGLNDRPPPFEREESEEHEAVEAEMDREAGTGREADEVEKGTEGEAEKEMEAEAAAARGTEAQRIHTYHRSKSSLTGTGGHICHSEKD